MGVSVGVDVPDGVAVGEADAVSVAVALGMSVSADVAVGGGVRDCVYVSEGRMASARMSVEVAVPVSVFVGMTVAVGELVGVSEATSASVAGSRVLEGIRVSSNVAEGREASLAVDVGANTTTSGAVAVIVTVGVGALPPREDSRSAKKPSAPRITTAPMANRPVRLCPGGVYDGGEGSVAGRGAVRPSSPLLSVSSTPGGTCPFSARPNAFASSPAV